MTNGATVQGKVTFSETMPDPKVFELRRYYDREYCATLSDGKGHRLLKEVIGPEGGIKDVVVVIEGIEKGKPFAFTDAEVEASLCQFLPFVTVVSDKSKVTVFNRDPVSHDIQGYAYDQFGVDIVLHRPALHVSGATDVVQLVSGHQGSVHLRGRRSCDGARMTTELVIQALGIAVWAKRLRPGLIHHSDRGSQYCAQDYQDQVRQVWHDCVHESDGELL